jgi:transposase InsO family protein
MHFRTTPRPAVCTEIETAFTATPWRRLGGMGITEVVSAPASPWQNPYVKRLIGSTRRECLDHVIVINETHLRRVLTTYTRYYHRSRTHLGLEKDTPDDRSISRTSLGPIVAIPEVGGLHHRYERRAA